MPKTAQKSDEKTPIQRELHSFNNQLFRASLLSESLQWKLQDQGKCEQPISDLLKKFRSAIQDISRSAKLLKDLVNEESSPS